MARHIIRLVEGEWSFDDSDRLGKPGGFGEVFIGEGHIGKVAVKRLKLTAAHAAHRELQIGQELKKRSLTHVVPILDAGQDAESDRYFLIMPICDHSLQTMVDAKSEDLDIDAVRTAVVAILQGLHEVRQITHRDLKPANVLFCDGTWKLADFGIAKFVEDSTSIETLRRSLTPAYAAPEQWMGERPTGATDIYALGCIIHALLEGSPPFVGSVDDIREKHLLAAPSTIPRLAPRFSAFVSQMLRKTPAARPTLDRCIRVLSELNTTTAHSGPHPAIDQAAKEVAEAEAKAEAEREAAETRLRERQRLFADAKDQLSSIREHLFARLRDSSENVRVIPGGSLEFGSSSLILRDAVELSDFIASRYARGERLYQYTNWDVAAWSIIAVTCSPSHMHPYTWSASLLYADQRDGQGFRWYELSFWSLSRSERRDEPFGLEGYEADIDLAAGNITHVVNIAYGPMAIDGEDEESFHSRWFGIVAKAAIGKLTRPSGMPIRSFP